MASALRRSGWLSIFSLGLLGGLLGCPAAGSDETGTEGSSGESGTTGGPGTTVVVDGSSGTLGTSGSISATVSATSGSTGDTGTADTTTTGGVVVECTDPATAVYPGPQREVDVLMVIDNSGTMAQAQINLVQAMDALVARLDEEGIDYRIGITTTDVGNPWCGSTSPESGMLVASSCRQRLSDFVFNGAMTIDVSNEACLDVCPHDVIALEPTTTDADPVPSPRPWLERIDGTTNLPAGVTPAEALRCLVPQGISGCGFERTLEGMYRALVRMQAPVDAAYGFLRPGADLLVVLVTDEVDCSHDAAYDTIFLPDGNRVFWSDPAAPAPTSAVCWNAGVECTGGPGTYDECHAQSYDVDGNATGPATAVLHDLSRYVDQLGDVDASNGPARVRMAVLGGVPLDYPAGGDPLYADSPDPIFQGDFGIGPGCDAGGVTALPPVRMREVAESFADPGERNVYSLCSPALCEAFELIVDDVVQ